MEDLQFFIPDTLNSGVRRAVRGSCPGGACEPCSVLSVALLQACHGAKEEKPSCRGLCRPGKEEQGSSPCSEKGSSASRGRQGRLKWQAGRRRALVGPDLMTDVLSRCTWPCSVHETYFRSTWFIMAPTKHAQTDRWLPCSTS